MTRQSTIVFSAMLFVAVMISSCRKKIDVPSFIVIDNIAVTSNYATQGTASSKITDAWVYIDGIEQGVYEMPARFPVIAEGRHQVTVAAGILVNGITATRTKYPFLNFHDTIIDLVPGKDIKIPSPVIVKYFSGLSYTWYEDFEGTGYTFKESSTSDAVLVPITSGVFEGSFSTKFTIDTDHPNFFGEMQEDFPIVTQSNTFFELNYKADQPFNIGMKVTTGVDTKTVYALTVNKSAEWNKIYVDLSKIVTDNQSADNFRVYIYASLDAGRSESVIYLDNLKLLHN